MEGTITRKDIDLTAIYHQVNPFLNIYLTITASVPRRSTCSFEPLSTLIAPFYCPYLECQNVYLA